MLRGCHRIYEPAAKASRQSGAIMSESNQRDYSLHAASTSTFGRVLTSARNHHFVVDGPVQNGCPGEELTPVEFFLAGVATCGVELVGVIAKSEGIPLSHVEVDIQGTIDRSRPVRSDVSLFNSVRLQFRMQGVTRQQGDLLVEKFKGR
jgi:uncharacterized OsmC-like protein